MFCLFVSDPTLVTRQISLKHVTKTFFEIHETAKVCSSWPAVDLHKIRLEMAGIGNEGVAVAIFGRAARLAELLPLPVPGQKPTHS